MDIQPPDKSVIDLFFELQEEVHKYFGYTEDWVSIPLEDTREMYWTLYENPDGSGHVRFHEEEEILKDFASGAYYEDVIYTQRFLRKWVYRTEKHTMVCVDTRTDGNKFLRIFDNSMEIKDSKPYHSYYDMMEGKP